MTDAAIIFRSHFEAIENLPEDQQLSALKAIIRYCMDDDTPADGTASCVLLMAKPVLDKWKSKREAGQKGGEANRKQTGSKPEPKEKEKEKVKEKPVLTDSKKEKHQYGEYKNVKLTDDEYQKLVDEMGEKDVKTGIQILDEYKETSGRSYKRDYLVIKGWVKDRIRERARPATRREQWMSAGGHRDDGTEEAKNKLIALAQGGFL